MTKDKSRLRIGFSAVAMALFVFYVMFRCLVVQGDLDLSNYDLRMNFLYYIVRFIPYVALFVFAIFERKLNKVNPRVYLMALFGILVVQSVIAGFWNNYGIFSYIGDLWSNIFGDAVFLILSIGWGRLIMFLAVSCMEGGIVKWCSCIMIGIYLFAMVIEICFDSTGVRFYVANYVEIVIDILFYVALYFFNDLCIEGNELGLLDRFYDFFLDRIYKDDYDEYDEEIEKLLDNEENSNNYGIRSYKAYCEYQKVLAYALYHEREDVLKAAAVFERLSHKNIVNGKGELYKQEFVFVQFEVLKKYTEELNELHSGFILDRFIELVDIVLSKKDHPAFFAEAVSVAVIFYNNGVSEWLDAADEINWARKKAREKE